MLFQPSQKMSVFLFRCLFRQAAEELQSGAALALAHKPLPHTISPDWRPEQGGELHYYGQLATLNDCM